MFNVTMTVQEQDFAAEMSTDAGFNIEYDETGTVSNDYEYLMHKPKINGVELIGDQTEAQIGIEALTISEMQSILEEILI